MEEPAAEEEEEDIPPVVDTGEYEDVAGAAARSAERDRPPDPAVRHPETAAPDEVTRAYSAISPEQAAAAAVDPPASAPPPGVRRSRRPRTRRRP